MAWDREKGKKAGKAMTIGSCIYGIVFLLVWCGLAARMGVFIMLLFGIPMLILMCYRLYVCIQISKEDKQKQPPKEPDPWDRPSISSAQEPPAGSGFCPYCGSSVQTDFEFCPKCGRRLS